MARSIKRITVLLITVTATVFIGASANALAQGVSEEDMREVRRVLVDKGKVPTAVAENIDILPLPAVVVFLGAGQGADSQTINKLYKEAMREIPKP